MKRLKRTTNVTYLQSEEQRKEFLDTQAHKNYVYYKNDHLGILDYLTKHLQSVISDDNVIRRMPKLYINDIPKIVKRLSLAYSNKPLREYSNELKGDNEDLINGTYKFYKEFHRQAKLLNTILVRPILKEGKHGKYFDFMILGRQFATVIESETDHNIAEEVQYKKYMTINGDKEIITFHWTESEYWATDENGETIKQSQLPDILTEGDNPYGRIPFVKLQLENSNDFWGDGLNDIVNMQEINNGKLCDALYKQWLSFGHPIGTNLGITADEYVVAPYKPFMINNAKTDEVVPNLEFKTPNHLVDTDKDLIDWVRRSGGTSKGLSASSFSDEEKDLSGYAKTIDSLELLELNRDDMMSLTDFEFDLFDMIKLEAEVNGVDIKTDLVNVTLQEYEFPKTTEELWKEREFKFKYGLETPFDWMQEDNPTMTQEEIEKKIKENRERKLTSQGGSIQSILERRNAPQGNNQL